jgi:hypothetical protein
VADRFTNRQGAARPNRGPVYDPDVPTAGFYRIVQRRGAPSSAVRIWLGPPIDPDTGEEMSERGYRWQAAVNGVRVPLEQVWPGCAREPITAAEHDRIVQRNLTMDEDSPFYDARKSVDLSQAPPPF